MVISTSAYQIRATMAVVARTRSTASRVTVLMDGAEPGVNATLMSVALVHVSTVEPAMTASTALPVTAVQDTAGSRARRR